MKLFKLPKNIFHATILIASIILSISANAGVIQSPKDVCLG